MPSSTTVTALGHLLRGEQPVLQGQDDRPGHDLDGPRDSGLGHAQLLADRRLYHIVTHVDQRRPQGVPQPQARRIPLDALLAQADEQIGELGSGQPWSERDPLDLGRVSSRDRIG